MAPEEVVEPEAEAPIEEPVAEGAGEDNPDNDMDDAVPTVEVSHGLTSEDDVFVASDDNLVDNPEESAVQIVTSG